MDGNPTPLYQDDRITINQAHQEENLVCTWHGDEPINHNYMEAKLSEYIGNNYAGSWPVQEKAEAGMRCFKLVWNEDILTNKWIR